jgi:cysteine synthase A
MDYANKDKGTKIYVKCEYFNPLSSVKDRLAHAIILHAEKTGALKPGQTVVEATSGNTGIGTKMSSSCLKKGPPFPSRIRFNRLLHDDDGNALP